ncbi:MAG TPA: glycosyltransferase family 4 protein, partial [Geminicoccaceae bacterium]|nr:glycosyltransferase family 4 protein [Geminicoccaceae bacterium]
PDLVQVNGFREAACDWGVPVVLVAHSCVGSWWRACRDGEALPAEWAAYLDGVRAGIVAADAVVAPTRSFLEEIAGLYGPLPRPTMIHNGRDLALPAGAGEGPRRPVILAAGRLWDEAKNVAALAQVAPRLPWPVLVAGEPPAEGGLQGVTHLGRLEPPDLLARMAEAEIFAAPARYEPFGLAVLEAAATGAALVLGDIPTLRELWDGAARFVPPDDPEALLATLRELIEDAPARRALQTAARTRARAHGRARMAEGYLALYEELLAARRRAHGAAA